MYVNEKLAVNRPNEPAENFYPHPQSFDAYFLDMCKQFCSKSYFPIRRKVSFLTGDNELKLGGLSVLGLKAEVKMFLKDIALSIFS